MKVHQKILLIGITLIVLIGLSVYFFTEYQSKIINNSYEQILTISKIQNKIVQVQNSISRFQIDDIISEDFFENNKSVNIDNYNKLMIELYELEKEYFDRNLEKTSDNTLNFNVHYNDIQTDFQNLINGYKILGYDDYGLEGSFSEAKDNFEEIYEEFDNSEIDILLEYLGTQEMKLIHRKLDKYLEKIEKTIYELLSFSNESGIDLNKETEIYLDYISNFYKQSQIIGLSDSQGLRYELHNSVNEANQFFESVADQLNQVMVVTAKNKIVFSLIFIFLGSLISSIAFFIFSKNVTSPINELSKVAHVITEGDLTIKVEDKLCKRKDEIGILAVSLNNTVENLESTVKQIKKSSKKTQDIKMSLHAKTIESNETANDININVESINSDIAHLDNQLNKSIELENKIEYEIDMLDKEIENQTSAVEESTASVNQMVASLVNVTSITSSKYEATIQLVDTTRQGGEKMSIMKGLVNDMQNSVIDISKMVMIINDIASRTSLLSMNAAIEAAHAGENGKGFAVVADEIRKLSESTANNAKSINTVLSTVKNQVENATSASDESFIAFGHVSTEVTSVSEALSEIKLASEEISSGGNQIIETMHILQEVSSKVKKGSMEMKTGAIEMGNAMNDVKKISSNVLQKVSHISDDSKKIKKSSHEIIQFTDELSLNANKLESEINRFKS